MLSAAFCLLALRPIGVDDLALTVRQPAKVSPPKKSPKHDWTFDTLTQVVLIEKEEAKVRFRVWSDGETQGVLEPGKVAKFLSKLYTYNMTKLRLDHSYLYGEQGIDVFLCKEGTAGGEQMFGEDEATDSNGRRLKVNAVFLYDVDTLDDPLEACRELAHEYGHATLPPVSIPGGREPWANGHLGERLYLSWLARDVKAGKVFPDDLFGATLSDLARYSSARIIPLLQSADKKFPGKNELARKNDSAFSAHLAQALYAERILPIEVFRRALLLNDDQSALGFHDAVLEAADEPSSFTMSAPVAGQAVFWVPMGTSQLSNCKVLTMDGPWAKVQSSGLVQRKNRDHR